MKHRASVGFLCLAACTVLAAPNPKSGPVSTGQSLQGELWARNEGESLWTAVGSEPRRASWFETDPKSTAVVSLENGGALRMEGGTTLHVVSATKDIVDMDVYSGKVFVSVPPSDKAISIADAIRRAW